ncbi:hypothetical protein B0H63DRAFT_476418 [Podospora didyma]|uniref:Uncharacterized protein n=1 Tax=Podospora didyma TaxID=330526 RepID=A0AAE0NHM2_9PEZI|nr:hypothetical protein B0H63DRAFT_476418 [Podospora didyma]
MSKSVNQAVDGLQVGGNGGFAVLDELDDDHHAEPDGVLELGEPELVDLPEGFRDGPSVVVHVLDVPDREAMRSPDEPAVVTEELARRLADLVAGQGVGLAQLGDVHGVVWTELGDACDYGFEACGQPASFTRAASMHSRPTWWTAFTLFLGWPPYGLMAAGFGVDLLGVFILVGEVGLGAGSLERPAAAAAAAAAVTLLPLLPYFVARFPLTS